MLSSDKKNKERAKSNLIFDRRLQCSVVFHMMLQLAFYWKRHLDVPVEAYNPLQNADYGRTQGLIYRLPVLVAGSTTGSN